MLTHIIESIKRKIALQSSEKFINYLRSKGVKIGKGCYIPNPKSSSNRLLQTHIIRNRRACQTKPRLNNHDS